MRVESELTRNGRYMVRATTPESDHGGRVLRLSVSVKGADWYHQLYASAWARRLVRDYLTLGALDPKAQMQHDEHEQALIVREDRYLESV